MTRLNGLNSSGLISSGLNFSAGRPVVLATIAALILTTSETPLAAASASRMSQGVSTTTVSGSVTDISARRRHRHYGHYRHGGGAAGAAFMGLALGVIGSAIAAQQRDEYYYSRPGYYYAPGVSYGPSYYEHRPYYYHQRYYRPF